MNKEELNKMLFDACKENDYKKAKEAIELGADIKYKDDTEAMLLIITSRNNNIDILKLLLKNGANVNAKDNFGRTPLHGIAFWCNEKEFKNKYGSIIMTAGFLLENGADINAKDNCGKTPLHEVVTIDFILCLTEFLIKNGADINAKDYFGRTPLHEAVSYHMFEAIKLLIEKGADVNAKTLHGDNVLDILHGHWECGFVDEQFNEIVKLLREKGVEC